jgi:hypothetical protein
MKAFIGCEESGEIRRALSERGHFAVSCDLLPARDGRNASQSWLDGVSMGAGKSGNVHVQGDVFTWLEWFRANGVHFDLLIAHPPCTYLTRAGWHWVNRPDSAPGVLPLKGAPRRRAAFEAAEFFRKLLDYPHIPRRAIENPRPIKHVNLPPATQYVQPWMFGHGEVKATGWWLVNLPPLVPTNVVEGREARIWKLPPSADRSKIRSATYPGIAAAIADQWGCLTSSCTNHQE